MQITVKTVVEPMLLSWLNCGVQNSIDLYCSQMTESVIPIECSCFFQRCMGTGLFQRNETYLPATARKRSVIVRDKTDQRANNEKTNIETSKKCPDEK